jgi:hypothetical protein
MFSVRTTAGKNVRFHVVARINGAIVKSTVQTFSTVAGTPVLATPTTSRVAVRSVKRVGKQFRVRVVAPKGAHVTLYRNGRKVTSGQKRTFSIKATSGKRVRFYVVARIDGAIVKSTVQTFSARSRK